MSADPPPRRPLSGGWGQAALFVVLAVVFALALLAVLNPAGP